MPCTPWTYIWLPASTPNQVSIQLCANNAGANVEATLTQYGYQTWNPDFRLYWTMYLQRVNINGGWETIGTRTGYVGVNSPSARTFTNVKRNNGNDALRVKVDFDPRYLHPDAYTKSLITPLLFR